jgi:putative membrane protein
MSVPPLVVCALAAALYALGGRGRAGGRGRGRRRRETAFYAGVLTLLVALEPPFDSLADRSFAVHMCQHVLLLSVVPPLVVLGRPWPRMWMPFPPAARRAAARSLARGGWSAPLRLAARTLTQPPVALVLMSTALVVWHLPALYDAAVDSEPIHLAEHASFLVTALLFWGPLLEAPPVKARIDHMRRAAYLGLAAVPGWVLAIVLAFAHHPLYPAYAALAHRPAGLSALADQQIAAGVMWVPGSLAYFVAFVVYVYRWLEPAPPSGPVLEPRHEELSWT